MSLHVFSASSRMKLSDVNHSLLQVSRSFKVTRMNNRGKLCIVHFLTGRTHNLLTGGDLDNYLS